MEEVRIITARRSFDFAPDEIRLTLLTLPDVVQSVQNAFAFQISQVATPPASFGVVPNVFPPGLVLNYGAFSQDETLTVIRFLNVEQRRVVVDVAGNSNATEAIYSRLKETVAGIVGTDGMPALGAPATRRDFTEIGFRSRILPERLISPFVQAFKRLTRKPTPAVAPAVVWRLLDASEEYPGLRVPDPTAFQLELRSGTRSGDQTFYSAAPLPTDEHLHYLEYLEEALTQTNDK